MSEESVSTSASQIMEEKILHALEIYPYLSASLIHMSIGTANPTVIWRPVLNRLVEEGKVVESVRTSRSATDRQQTYSVYHLPKNNYAKYM